jgi:hypothetical protein
MPNCNKQCNEAGHWLQQAAPAPWQVQHEQDEATSSTNRKD